MSLFSSIAGHFPSISSLVTTKIVRNAVVIGGAFLEGNAHLSHDQTQMVLGAVVTVTGLAWSIAEGVGLPATHNAVVQQVAAAAITEAQNAVANRQAGYVAGQVAGGNAPPI